MGQLGASGGALAIWAALAAPARAETIVTLTFDDGTEGQDAAGAVLAARGLRATFFVNSGRANGESGYLGWPAVAALSAEGHEVSGHTITHADLSVLDAASERHEICDDRAAFVSRGYAARVLAYPYGRYGTDTAAIAQECGYIGARTSSGLRSVGGCFACDVAETIPPFDVYAIRTPGSIRDVDGLDVIEGYVTQAESGGGGWVTITFHRICDGCGTLSTPLPTLTAFADWLAERVAAGTVVVKPFGDVLGGPEPAREPPPDRPAGSGCASGAGAGWICALAMGLLVVRVLGRSRKERT